MYRCTQAKNEKRSSFWYILWTCKWKDIRKCWHFFCTSIAEEIHHTVFCIILMLHEHERGTNIFWSASESLSQGNVFRILFPVMGEAHSRIFRIFCYDTFKSWKITKSVSFQICFVTTMKRYMRWTKHIWYAKKFGYLMHTELADFPITHKKNI